VGGVEASDGHRVPADQKIDGGPSVLYDAIIVLAAKDGAEALAALPAARDFVTDAYAHCKFIGYTGDAAPLFEAAGLSRLPGVPAGAQAPKNPGAALAREMGGGVGLALPGDPARKEEQAGPEGHRP